MNPSKILNVLLIKPINNNTVKHILENIKNNQINTGEIIYLAKYGAFHKNCSLVQLAYIHDVDIHVDDDYIFRKAYENDDTDILICLLKDNYDYFEKVFFRKKSVPCSIIENIINSNIVDMYDSKINLPYDCKIIIKKILMYMFVNDINIYDDFIFDILRGNMEPQLIEILEQHDDFIELFFGEDTFDDCFEILTENRDLLRIILKKCTNEQTDKIIEYHYDNNKKIPSANMLNPDYMLTPEAFFKCICDDYIIINFSKIPINKKLYIDFLSKKITTDYKKDSLLIAPLIYSKLFTENELTEHFDKTHIDKCLEYFNKTHRKQEY